MPSKSETPDLKKNLKTAPKEAETGTKYQTCEDECLKKGGRVFRYIM